MLPKYSYARYYNRHFMLSAKLRLSTTLGWHYITRFLWGTADYLRHLEIRKPYKYNIQSFIIMIINHFSMS